MSLKKPLTLFLVLFLFTSYLTPTHAAPAQKSLVIIDTGEGAIGAEELVDLFSHGLSVIPLVMVLVRSTLKA